MQHIMITGGNAGIGKATAMALAKKGAKIIIASRNITKAREAVIEIKGATKNNEIYNVECDLSSFDSIRTCVRDYKNRFGQLDILINNAGLVADKLQFTKEGFELQIGVNHLGHFLLTNELINLLLKSNEPRIINLSSKAHYKGRIDFDSFRGEAGALKYNGMAAYRQSKLANVLFTKELATRYPKICSHSLHPGIVRTEIAQKNGNGNFWKVMWKIITPFKLSTENGAKTSVYLASSDEPINTNGKYYSRSKEIAPSSLATNKKLAKELWDKSIQLIAKY